MSEQEEEPVPVGTYGSWFEAEAAMALLADGGFDPVVLDSAFGTDDGPVPRDADTGDSAGDERPVEIVVPQEQANGALGLLAAHAADPFSDESAFGGGVDEHDELDDELMVRRTRVRRLLLAPMLLVVFFVVLSILYLIGQAMVNS